MYFLGTNQKKYIRAMMAISYRKRDMNIIRAPTLVLGIEHSFKQINTCSFVGYTATRIDDTTSMNRLSTV